MSEARHAWLRRLIDAPTMVALASRVESSKRVVARGSQGSSAAITAGVLAARLERMVVLVVPHLDDADDTIDDLELFGGAGVNLPTARFPALEVLPGESSVSLELLAERVETVTRLAEKYPAGSRVLVAPIQALMQAVPEPSKIGAFTLSLRRGGQHPPAKVIDWLAETGCNRVDAIEQPGEFAVRGGIIDIYPPTGGMMVSTADGVVSEAAGAGAVRIDFFGDEIDTICRIDPDMMASGEQLKAVRLLGASTKLLQSDDDTINVLSLLPADALVVLHEVLELSEQARGYFERLTNPRGIYPPRAVFQTLTSRRHVEINQFSSTAASEDTVQLPVRPLGSFDRDAGKAVAEAGELTRENEVVLLCPKDAERERLLELLKEHAAGATPAVETGYLHRGFIWGDEGDTAGRPLVLAPQQELFHRYDVRRRVRRVAGPGNAGEAGVRAQDAFLDINAGDFVVHVDHGIAKFNGLKTMRKEGKSEEYLTLEFAQGALLHVPATQIELVQKYVGGFHGHPPLSTLGGRRWQKQKEQAAEAVKDLAAEMLRVQAARASMPGIRYPADTPWQHEFEAEFPYDETEDQLAAISAIKRDMANERPMDRLICGDVGFGKTEVAIRAAFKAAEFGKQVAVLVPTTVLAEQHERTFRARMADYPFRIVSLSRFKSPAEVRESLEAIKAGQVDIVIGTHRLLSKDVEFADLGLVVIDEEQRFGVEHKQKLMQFRMTVDVLTLSATPIPRTLHMSMLGLRDISSLTTAPADRRATVTEVIAYDPQRIKQALVRELNREGQVYFVHNRIHDILSVADDLQRLVPDARIVVGHGQMPPHQLEEVMLKFIRRDADILVSTTIIEAGLDIPNANTMFIHNADHFGLADLHQLRGRVGRYKHRAYCYLLLPEDRPVSDAAAQRLRAVEKFSMLGAGFKIAMRDLEIRGAGNLLGAEQSGHIAAVGYELYCQLLEQATRRLNQQQQIEPAKTHVELPVAGQIPKAYIGSDKFRMEAYRRVSRAVALDELRAVAKALTDAYGPPPPPAQTLIDLAEIRLGATLLGIEAIKLEGPDLIFRTPKPAALDAVFRDAPGRASVIDHHTVYYRPPPAYLEPPTLLAVLRKLMVRNAEKPAPPPAVAPEPAQPKPPARHVRKA